MRLMSFMLCYCASSVSAAREDAGDERSLKPPC